MPIKRSQTRIYWGGCLKVRGTDGREFIGTLSTNLCALTRTTCFRVQLRANLTVNDHELSLILKVQ